ncbi:MAG: metal-dependent hydrolase [Actinobacteria bacterium]|nr:metal-dependent hydrolase [Actinomycetota bacterium]
MFLWFAGLAFVLVWHVFRDTAIDYRLVMAGAVAPDVVDGLLGGARVLHTLSFGVVLLLGVMLATRGRRVLRRQLLAVPIGVLLHLVLDSMWARTEVFWWPFFGWSFAGAGLPSAERSVGLVVVQEAAGAVALWWSVGRWRLTEPERRRMFLRTGRLSRDLVA